MLRTLLRKLGAPLVLAAALFQFASLHAGAEPLRMGGTGSALGTARLLADALAKTDPATGGATVLPSLGSSGGLRALTGGAIEIALISRPLTLEEMSAGLVAFEYGRSPFALVTSRTDVTTLSASQVADFLSGRTEAWPDGQRVRFVLRPTNDIDSTLLASFSPEIAQALKIARSRPGMVIAATDQDAADEAQRLPGALSTNTLALLLSERRTLRVVAFGGVMPSAKTLADGTYPFFKRMYMVTRGAPRGAAGRFIVFVRSPEGRAVLRETGHVVGE